MRELRTPRALVFDETESVLVNVAPRTKLDPTRIATTNDQRECAWLSSGVQNTTRCTCPIDRVLRT